MSSDPEKREAESLPDASEERAVEELSLARRIWDQVWTLGVAILIALSIRAFLIEPFRIPSESMLPTLLIGDHLFVNKFLYGARVPFTDWHLPSVRDPQRGDVVVFSVARGRFDQIHPADKRPDLPRDDFVKRLVGLPGDRVEVQGEEVRINGELVGRVSAKGEGARVRDDSGRLLDGFWEDLTGCGHAVLQDPVRANPARSISQTIPPDRYFFMGDNRDHSNDSRSWGTVHRSDLKGPAFILYWSWSVNGNVLEFLNPLNWWTADKRWGRIFQRVRCADEPAPA